MTTLINRPSRLILAAIDGGYYKPDRAFAEYYSPYLCNALLLVPCADPSTVEETRALISERLDGRATLAGYLHTTRQGYVSWADRLDFWAEFVRQLQKQEEHIDLLHDALVELRQRVQDGTHESTWGICSQLFLEGGVSLPVESRRLLRKLNNSWPSASRMRAYPVPHPFLDPAEAYCVVPDLWDTNSSDGHASYASARRELLDYLIEVTA